jgi:ubiquinone/menaquinone biosynthesis C-methylase UbiE
MDKMDNGTSQNVIEFFNQVALMPDSWDHNQQYQSYMLRQIKKGKPETGLEIGCGTGEFCRRLAEKCQTVIGIDVAPRMIDAAKRRNSSENITYLLTDVNTFLADKANCFDVITSIAAFHHMDGERTLAQCKRALKDGGILIIQDLYHENTFIFKFLSLVGALVNPFFMLAKNGRFWVTPEERQVWASHFKDDHYQTLAQLRAQAQGVLEGASLKRHIFWRYTLVYIKHPIGHDRSDSQ